MVEFPKFKGFTEETKLHGIPRTAEGSKLSISFWSVLVVICVAMAIKDLYFLVDNYKAEPTAIQMTLQRLPKDFNWTTPTLCMDMMAQYDENYTSWLNFSDPAAAISTMLSQLHKTVSNFNYTEIQLWGTNSKCALETTQCGLENPNNLYYSYMVLGYLTDLERQLMNQSRQNDYQLGMAINDPLLDEHVQLYYAELNRQNVSMATLMQLVGMWYCLLQLIPSARPDMLSNMQIFGHMENYRYFGDPQYIRLPMCKANMITHLGFGMVCSKLFETPNVPLRPKYNYFVIYDTRLTHGRYDDQCSSGCNAKIVTNLLFHLDLQGRNVIPTEDHTNIFSWK